MIVNMIHYNLKQDVYIYVHGFPRLSIYKEEQFS